MKKMEKAQKQKLIEMYQSGSTPSELAKIFNIFPNSVNRIIRQSGGQSNQLKRVSIQDVEIIVKRYQNGESSELIAKDFNVDGTTICRILKRNHIEIRPATKNKRIYKIDEDYFQCIDSQDKAYFLGFLFSDGNISKEKNDIKISLKYDDEEIIKELSKLIYGFEHIHYYNYENDGICVNINITSQKMKQDLINLGCPPDKTFIIRYPDIDMKYDASFIRGYFDGDGCFSVKKDERGTFDITSNTNFIKDVCVILKKHLDIDVGVYIDKDNENTACLQTTDREKLKKLFGFLYKDANLFMKRKYEKFKQLLELVNAKENIAENKNDLVEFWFKYFRDKGFPYFSFTNNELLKDFNSLCLLNIQELQNNKIFSSYKPSGLKIFKHFNPHFFSVSSKNKCSMIDAFNNDETLLAVIKNRMEGGFNMSNNMLIQGMRNGFFAFHPSIFYPYVAKYLYETYCKDGDIIYDYSAGFGQRMLGALSTSKKIKYIGCDPWNKNIEALNKIVELLSTSIPDINERVKLIQLGAENYIPNESISVAFSSPPYFDKELYINEPTQSYMNGYNEFINTWWDKVCRNINTALKKDGVFILNMKERVDNYNILKDMLAVCEKYGFQEVDRYHIQLSRNIKYLKRNEIKLEPIIIMKRI